MGLKSLTYSSRLGQPGTVRKELKEVDLQLQALTARYYEKRVKKLQLQVLTARYCEKELKT